MASLLALPIGCGGSSDDPGSQSSDSAGGDNNPKDSDSAGNNDGKDTDSNTGGENPDDNGSKPDTGDGGDSTGGGSKGAVKPSEGSIDCGAIQSTGITEGDVAPNVTLTDAGGNKISLHDYCNDYVLIVAGAAY